MLFSEALSRGEVTTVSCIGSQGYQGSGTFISTESAKCIIIMLALMCSFKYFYVRSSSNMQFKYSLEHKLIY